MSNENVPIPKISYIRNPWNHKESIEETSVVKTESSLSSNAKVETSTAHKEVHNTIKSSHALAKGVSSIHTTAIKDFVSKAVDVKSQDQLCFAIDCLTKGFAIDRLTKGLLNFYLFFQFLK